MSDPVSILLDLFDLPDLFCRISKDHICFFLRSSDELGAADEFLVLDLNRARSDLETIACYGERFVDWIERVVRIHNRRRP